MILPIGRPEQRPDSILLHFGPHSSAYVRYGGWPAIEEGLARRPQDVEVLKADFERGRRMGLDVQFIPAELACQLNPFLFCSNGP
jgi:hypothetical protein